MGQQGDTKKNTFSDKEVAHLTREVREVLESGDMIVDQYAEAREAGATHREVMAAYKAFKTLYWYANAREAGATHDEVVAAGRAGLHVGRYAEVREAGVTHDEVVAAGNTFMSLQWYEEARKAGATHDEVVAADNADVDHSMYLIILMIARDHELAMAVLAQL